MYLDMLKSILLEPSTDWRDYLLAVAIGVICAYTAWVLMLKGGGP